MFWCLFFNLQAVLWRTKTVWLRQQVSIVLKPRLKGLNILLGIIQYFQSNIVGLFDHFCWTMFSASFICPTSTEHCLVDVRSCWTTLVSTLLCRQIKQHYWSVLVQTLIQCHWLLLDYLNAPYDSKSPVFNLEVFVDLWWNAGHAVYWILAERLSASNEGKGLSFAKSPHSTPLCGFFTFCQSLLCQKFHCESMKTARYTGYNITESLFTNCIQPLAVLNILMASCVINEFRQLGKYFL